MCKSIVQIPVVYGLNDPSKGFKSDFVGLIKTMSDHVDLCREEHVK